MMIISWLAETGILRYSRCMLLELNLRYFLFLPQQTVKNQRAPRLIFFYPPANLGQIYKLTIGEYDACSLYQTASGSGVGVKRPAVE